MRKSPITHPLKQPSLEQAIQMQFKLVEILRKHFNGRELMVEGDYGHQYIGEVEGLPVYKHSAYTTKVEEVLGEFFGRKAILVWGAGTGANRMLFMAALRPGDRVILDEIYASTGATMRAMNLDVVQVNYNNLDELRKAIDEKTKMVHIIHGRGFKRFDPKKVIDTVRSTKYDPLISFDENYVAMRVPKIGTQLGADLSAFSLQKLLGPEGIGVIISGTERGDKVIDRIHWLESAGGGSMVQGPDAMRALKNLVYTPVMWAIQRQVVDEVCERLNKGEVDGVDWAVVAHLHMRVVIVKLEEPIVRKVIDVAWKYGNMIHTIGCEGKDEITCRISPIPTSEKETVPAGIPLDCLLRVIPFRAGPDTIIDILKKSIEEARKSK
jgi:hypothetical protein